MEKKYSIESTFRNHILLSGFGYNGGGILAIGNKLLIGGFTQNSIRTYSFIEGHVGLYKSNDKEFNETPLFFDMTCGGGIDIYTSNKLSFFVEIGGGFSSFGADFKGKAHLGVGFRTFWK